MRAQVLEDYLCAYPNPIRLRAGDCLVSVEERRSEWPGWLWCTNERGVRGWVPRTYLAERAGLWRMKRDYEATELTVTAGDEVELENEESGWLWCKSSEGERGWLPRNVLAVRE